MLKFDIYRYDMIRYDIILSYVVLHSGVDMLYCIDICCPYLLYFVEATCSSFSPECHAL